MNIELAECMIDRDIHLAILVEIARGGGLRANNGARVRADMT
ncbi:MAG: hypothetical protein ABSF64_13895 [Bryobacteraceae bacterium]